MASSEPWEVQKQQIRALVSSGEPIEAMKTIMLELRAFSEEHNVHAMPVDTSSYYKNPAGFGRFLKTHGVADSVLGHFAGILAARGEVFLVLAQPSRSLPDLEAALEIHADQDAATLRSLEQARSQVEAAKVAERRAEAQKRVPVTVLTGFLGAGKTTLLNHVLRTNHGRKYAVIENELGQVGIDNQLIDKGLAARTTETVVLLDNGCLCCTVRSDLIGAISQILDKAEAAAANRRASAGPDALEDTTVLDGILIETTGLADPGPVCKTFYAENNLRDRTRIDGVLTVVDALHFLLQLNRARSFGAVNESAQQVAFADTVLLNKVDLVSPADLSKVEAAISSINQACRIVHCSLGLRPNEVPLDELLGREGFCLDRILEDFNAPEISEPLAKRRRGGVPLFCGTIPLSRHDVAVSTCSFTITDAPLVLERFMQVMNSIRAENAVDLYRYKGAVCVKEPGGVLKRAVLQGIHDMCEFEPRGRWPSGEPPRSELVFIGRNLDKELWGRLFEKAKEGILDDDSVS